MVLVSVTNRFLIFPFGARLIFELICSEQFIHKKNQTEGENLCFTVVTKHSAKMIPFCSTYILLM